MPAPAGAGRARLLTSPALPRPILLVDAAEVEAVLRAITRGWGWRRRPVPAGDEALAAIRVRGTAKGYVVDSDWLGAPIKGLSAVSAACSVTADLGLGTPEARPGQLALHCGARQARCATSTRSAPRSGACSPGARARPPLPPC